MANMLKSKRRMLALVANEVQGKGKFLMDAFRRNSAALENIQRHLLEERRKQEARARFFSQAVLVTTIVLSLLLVAAAAAISRRFDARRIQGIRADFCRLCSIASAKPTLQRPGVTVDSDWACPL
jgi:hypothetical protein